MSKTFLYFEGRQGERIIAPLPSLMSDEKIDLEQIKKDAEKRAGEAKVQGWFWERVKKVTSKLPSIRR